MSGPGRAGDIACDINVFSVDERDEHAANFKAWHEAVITTAELERGYRFELERREGLVVNVARFIALESRCCPFFEFDLHVPAEGPLAFTITGPPGARELLAGTAPPAQRAAATSG